MYVCVCIIKVCECNCNKADSWCARYASIKLWPASRNIVRTRSYIIDDTGRETQLPKVKGTRTKHFITLLRYPLYCQYQRHRHVWLYFEKAYTSSCIPNNSNIKSLISMFSTTNSLTHAYFYIYVFLFIVSISTCHYKNILQNVVADSGKYYFPEPCNCNSGCPSFYVFRIYFI
jgi:hypothetical protein